MSAAHLLRMLARSFNTTRCVVRSSANELLGLSIDRASLRYNMDSRMASCGVYCGLVVITGKIVAVSAIYCPSD